MKCIVVLLLLALMQQTHSELFTSLSDLEGLLTTERELIHIMTNYISAEQSRLVQLQQVLEDLKVKHNNAAVDGPSYVANPINSYLLVKRLSMDWDNIKSSIVDNHNKDPIVNVSSHRADLVFPDVEDLHGAAIALIRLQETYDLDASKLAVGQIDGAKPSLALTANDCFELGRHSYVNKDYKHTIDWMDVALQKVQEEPSNSNSNTVRKADILEYTAFAHYMMGKIKMAHSLTKELLAEDPNHHRAEGNLKHYEKMLADKADAQKRGDDGQLDDDIPEEAKVEPNPIPEREQYEKLCRGHKMMSVQQESKLRCRWYQCKHPMCILIRYKEEEAHLDPRVVRYHDVLSDHEISIIQMLASPKLQRATVQHHETGELIPASYRISKSAWLSNGEHQVVAKVNTRISMLTNLNVQTAEELQIANYGLGGHYEPHYDFAREEEVEAFKSLGVGNRIATVLFYMTDLEAGGSTVFTKLGIAVKPIKGTAVFWFNLFKSGKGDLRTRHAACPVLAGNKWVSNKWLHEYGQEFMYPCDLNPHL